MRVCACELLHDSLGILAVNEQLGQLYTVYQFLKVALDDGLEYVLIYSIVDVTPS